MIQEQSDNTSSEQPSMQQQTFRPRMASNKPYNKLALWSLVLYGTAFSTQAIEVQGYGFHPLGSVVPVMVTTRNVSNRPGTPTPAPRTIGLFKIAPPVGSSPLCEDSSILPNTLTPDGKYYGWELASGSGIYGVIYNSSVTAYLDGSGSDPRTTITLNWGSNGKVSYTSSHGAWGLTHCYSSTPVLSYYSFISGRNTISSGNIKYGIYVAPGAAAVSKQYDFSFYISKWYSSPTSVQETVDLYFTDCTVTTPSRVRFGTVDAGSETPVISADGGLDIACVGGSPTVNLSYSAQAVSSIQSPTELVMKNSQNQTQGIVRGFIGSSADSDARCSNSATSVRFDDTTTPLQTGAANNQSHSFPLKWVLCPERTAQPGEGNASAVLSINWQ
ncbi:TPA: hypothetical protein O8L60_004720 [Enterobacter cloacae]|nr:hypothetical protein [Enterobacter cloacae]